MTNGKDFRKEFIEHFLADYYGNDKDSPGGLAEQIAMLDESIDEKNIATQSVALADVLIDALNRD